MAFFGCPETDRKQDLIKCRYPNYTWIEKKMKEPKSTIFLGANKKKRSTENRQIYGNKKSQILKSYQGFSNNLPTETIQEETLP